MHHSSLLATPKFLLLVVVRKEWGMHEPLRVLLAEDHALVRAGFHALLQNLPGVLVVAEAGDGQEALQQIEAHRPDLVLLDITMPRLSGIEVAARTTKLFPHMRVIILSMHANEEYVWEALHAGALGYLLKDANIDELKLALAAVTRGEPYLSAAVSKYVIAGYVRRGESNQIDLLTPRQREILRLIAEGHTTHDIAVMLQISDKTVETHRSQLMRRLSLRDVTSVVRFAIRHGLVALSLMAELVDSLLVELVNSLLAII
jgi:DNA-binding NarL/FixJ family response regulator